MADFNLGTQNKGIVVSGDVWDSMSTADQASIARRNGGLEGIVIGDKDKYVEKPSQMNLGTEPRTVVINQPETFRKLQSVSDIEKDSGVSNYLKPGQILLGGDTAKRYADAKAQEKARSVRVNPLATSFQSAAKRGKEMLEQQAQETYENNKGEEVKTARAEYAQRQLDGMARDKAARESRQRGIEDKFYKDTMVAFGGDREFFAGMKANFTKLKDADKSFVIGLNDMYRAVEFGDKSQWEKKAPGLEKVMKRLNNLAAASLASGNGQMFRQVQQRYKNVQAQMQKLGISIDMEIVNPKPAETDVFGNPIGPVEEPIGYDPEDAFGWGQRGLSDPDPDNPFG